MSQEPASDTEKWMMDAWHQIGLDPSEPQCDFFEVGGASLAAMYLIALVDEKYGENIVTTEEIFEKRTIRNLSMMIDSRRERFVDSRSED